MAKYSMTCTCGQVTSVDAANRDEAVAKIKAMMTPEAVAAHFAEKHVGQPVPSQEQIGAMTEQYVQEGDAGAAAPM